MGLVMVIICKKNKKIIFTMRWQPHENIGLDPHLSYEIYGNMYENEGQSIIQFI